MKNLKLSQILIQFEIIEGEPTDFCFVKSLNEIHRYTEYHWRDWVGAETYDKSQQDIFAVNLFLSSKSADEIYEIELKKSSYNLNNLNY